MKLLSYLYNFAIKLQQINHIKHYYFEFRMLKIVKEI